MGREIVFLLCFFAVNILFWGFKFFLSLWGPKIVFLEEGLILGLGINPNHRNEVRYIFAHKKLKCFAGSVPKLGNFFSGTVQGSVFEDNDSPSATEDIKI